MPSAPLRYCVEPNCAEKTAQTRCAAHQRTQRQQETRYQHGTYGRPWRRLRDAHLREQPFCVECAKAGRDVLADEVDHIIRHKGDLTRLRDPENLQSLCRSHHAKKTALEVGLGLQKK